VDPDEYQVFKPLLERPGKDPVIHVGIGAKRCKAVYAGEQGTDTVDTTDKERRARVLQDDEVLTLAR
jgi:pyruvate,water dikinase